MLLVFCIVWLLFALGMCYVISFSGKSRHVPRVGLSLILVSYVTGLALMFLAVRML